MKRLFTAACVCALLAASSLIPSSLEASEALKSIVGSYLQIHGQLATDKTDGVKDAASAIATQAAAMGESGAAIGKAAKAVAEASDLKGARDAFGPLSEAVVAAADKEGWKDLGVKQAFCPMVKRPWIQKDEKLKNPYYGSLMLECGEFKK